MAGPITHIGEGTAAANTVAGTTLAVPYPASIAAGDVLVLHVFVSSATLPTNPGGSWQSADTSTSGGSSPSLRTSVLKATGSETGSLNVTTPNATSQGWMMQFRGVDQTTQIDVAGTAFGSSTAVTAYDLPTLTTTLVGAALVYAGCGNTAAGTFTPPTNPAAFSEVRDLATTTPKATSGYLIWSSSGASGTVNLVSSSSVRGAATLIALRPVTFSGTLAATLADATLAAAGSVANSTSGTLAATLAGATLAATGTETISGTLAASVAGATLAAAGQESESGTLAVALQGATLVAFGTPTVTGTLTATLAGATLAAIGLESDQGVLAVTLAGATLAASGIETIPGTLTVTLAGASLAAVGTAAISGTLAVTLTGARLTAVGWAGFPRDLTLTGRAVKPHLTGGTVAPVLTGASIKPRITGRQEP